MTLSESEAAPWRQRLVRLLTEAYCSGEAEVFEGAKMSLEGANAACVLS